VEKEMCDITGTLSPREQMNERRAAQIDSHTHTTGGSVYYRPHSNKLVVSLQYTNPEALQETWF